MGVGVGVGGGCWVITKLSIMKKDCSGGVETLMYGSVTIIPTFLSVRVEVASTNLTPLR